jgi:hypothetical protein
MRVLCLGVWILANAPWAEKEDASTSEKDIFFTKVPRTEVPIPTLGKTTEAFVGLSGDLPSCKAKFVDPIPNLDR